MAFLAPYTCDVSPRCRQWAAQCITCLMSIEAQSRVTSWEEEELLSASKDLQSDVPSSRFKASSRMAKVVSAHFPTDQALDFIEVILENMVSGNEMCATAAGHWLLTLLQDCGGAMKAQISNILDTFYSRLPTIKQEDLRQVLVDAVSILAHYHLDAVFSSLLCRRLPMDSETGELWRSLGRDPSLASLVLHELAGKIQMQPSAPENSLPSGTEESVEFADEEPLKATCAIYEVISTLPSKEVVHKLYPELFCALLGQASRTLGQQMPVQEGRRKLFLRDQQVSEGNPCRLSVASLKALLWKMTCDRPLAQIRAGTIWDLLRDRSTHHEGVCLLTRALYESGLLYHSVIHNILPWMESSSEKLRLTGTAFFTEAIWDPSMGEKTQLKKVLPIVIKRAGDQDHNIRRMAIRGLGNILLVAPDKRSLFSLQEELRNGEGEGASRHHVKPYPPRTTFGSLIDLVCLRAQRCFSCDRAAKLERKTIIAVLQGALNDDKVVLESLKVLALIFPYLKGKDVGFFFKDICIQTVSYLDDDDHEIRNAAFKLFGVLASWTTFRYKTFFAELVKRSLVTFLIHLQDPCPLVSETCRSALLKAARFFLKRRLRTHLEELHRTTNLNFPNLHVHICRQLMLCSSVIFHRSLHAEARTDLLAPILSRRQQIVEGEWIQILLATSDPELLKPF